MQVHAGRTARKVSTTDCSNPNDSPEHRAWRQDRALRRRVPPHEAWRGCLGLAMLLERPDDTEAYGDRALVRNEQVTWLALRDLPARHAACTNSRDWVNYANSAVAELRHGMPVLDFRRDRGDGVDFGLIPSGDHHDRSGDVMCRLRPDRLDGEARRREFAVLNAVSAAMTRFACFATDTCGRSARPPWAARRPRDGAPFRPQPPLAWLPRPYLALPFETKGSIFDLVTGARRPDRTSRSTEAWPCSARGCIPLPMRDGFCAGLAEGLKACACGPEVYCGTCLPGRASSGGHRAPSPDWVPHRLKSRIDGARRVVYLPRSAHVLAGPGQAIEAGEPWAKVLPPARREWRRRKPEHRWATADEPCGGSGWAASLLRLWFEQQLVRMVAEPDQVLVPADFVACAARALRPLGLWWDTAPALAHYGWELEAAMFPPLTLRRWSGLRLALPGDLLLDAGVAGPPSPAGGIPYPASAQRGHHASRHAVSRRYVPDRVPQSATV